MFGAWFGIHFKDNHCFAYICSPHSSEILTVYGLSTLIPLYKFILSATQICTLVLNVFPFRVSKNIAHLFLLDIVPPVISTPKYAYCVSNCFTLQSIPAQ